MPAYCSSLKDRDLEGSMSIWGKNRRARIGGQESVGNYEITSFYGRRACRTSDTETTCMQNIDNQRSLRRCALFVGTTERTPLALNIFIRRQKLLLLGVDCFFCHSPTITSRSSSHGRRICPGLRRQWLPGLSPHPPLNRQQRHNLHISRRRQERQGASSKRHLSRA